MTEKLYEITLTVSVFALANSEAEARQQGLNYIRDESAHREDLDIVEVTHKEWPTDGSWDKTISFAEISPSTML
jgi:hypothetical protein